MNVGKNVQLASEMERDIFEKFWNRIHVKTDYLKNHLLVRNVLLRIDHQLFLLEQSLFSLLKDRALIVLENVPDLKIIQLGIFIGRIQGDNFHPSLGFLHLIDEKNCREIILPSSLVGAFTRGKTLYVTSALKIKPLMHEHEEDLIYVVKNNDFLLGLGVLDVLNSSSDHELSLQPILHVGEYLSAEGERFI